MPHSEDPELNEIFEEFQSRIQREQQRHAADSKNAKALLDQTCDLLLGVATPVLQAAVETARQQGHFAELTGGPPKSKSRIGMRFTPTTNDNQGRGIPSKLEFIALNTGGVEVEESIFSPKGEMPSAAFKPRASTIKLSDITSEAIRAKAVAFLKRTLNAH